MERKADWQIGIRIENCEIGKVPVHASRDTDTKKLVNGNPDVVLGVPYYQRILYSRSRGIYGVNQNEVKLAIFMGIKGVQERLKAGEKEAFAEIGQNSDLFPWANLMFVPNFGKSRKNFGGVLPVLPEIHDGAMIQMFGDRTISLDREGVDLTKTVKYGDISAKAHESRLAINEVNRILGLAINPVDQPKSLVKKWFFIPDEGDLGLILKNTSYIKVVKPGLNAGVYVVNHWIIGHTQKGLERNFLYDRAVAKFRSQNG